MKSQAPKGPRFLKAVARAVLLSTVVSPRRVVLYWPQKGGEMMSMLKNYSDFEVHYALSLASALFADYLRTTPSASAQQKADAFNQCLEGALSNAKLFTAERNEN